jgi:hypothetical protein
MTITTNYCIDGTYFVTLKKNGVLVWSNTPFQSVGGIITLPVQAMNNGDVFSDGMIQGPCGTVQLNTFTPSGCECQ